MFSARNFRSHNFLQVAREKNVSVWKGVHTFFFIYLTNLSVAKATQLTSVDSSINGCMPIAE